MRTSLICPLFLAAIAVLHSSCWNNMVSAFTTAPNNEQRTATMPSTVSLRISSLNHHLHPNAILKQQPQQQKRHHSPLFIAQSPIRSSSSSKQRQHDTQLWNALDPQDSSTANGSTPSTSLLRVCGDSTSRNSESLLNSTSTSYSACSSSSIHLPLSPSARQRPSPRCACPHECTPWRSTWRHIRARYSAEPAVSAGTVQLTCDPNLCARVCKGMPVQMSMHTGMTLLHLSACHGVIVAYWRELVTIQIQ